MPQSTISPKRPAQPPRRASLSGGRKNAPYKARDKFADIMKETVIDKAVDLMTAARNESDNGRLKRDTMAGILSALPPDCTTHMLYNRERKRRRVKKEILGTTIEEEVDVPELKPALNKGGRPLGATNEAERDREEREGLAKADAVEALLARWAARQPGRRSGKDELKLIIEAAKKKFNVEDLIIREGLIRQRAKKGNLSNLTKTGRVSPMLEIEPVLVTFVIRLQRIANPLDPAIFLALANSSIEGTPLEEKILASKNGGTSGAANGKKYYQGFMKRNRDEIDSKRPRKFPADRTNWTTNPNIDAFYEACDILFAQKVKTGQPATIVKTDIIPLVNAAWDRSFARQE
jgi:hypothetical protein